MNNFIPNQPNEAPKVPFFDDVTSEDGWQGHATSKSIETLKTEVTKAISRLGGVVSGFQRGVFNIDGKKREGFQIHYALSAPGGKYVPGRLDVASLPVRYNWRSRRSEDERKEQSLRMALYMLRNAIDGLWFLQQLSPGYAPLMPWMLTPEGKTVSQMWADSSVMNNLLPPGDSEFVEAEVVEQ